MKMWYIILIAIICVYILPPIIKNVSMILTDTNVDISETPLVHGEYE
jgi:heme/copper-type cytochrome/quinol oxidase subunit 1